MAKLISSEAQSGEAVGMSSAVPQGQGQHAVPGPSSAAAAYGRGRRATFAGVEKQQSALWTAGFTGNGPAPQQPQQRGGGGGPPPGGAVTAASRYGRASIPGTNGHQARPPMRRTRTSLAHGLGTVPPSRYNQQQLWQAENSMQSQQQQQQQQAYSPVRQMPAKLASSASLFSRGGAAANNQRFIAMPPDDSFGGDPGDDDVFAPKTWDQQELPSLQIYAKQLQQPRSGIPSKEEVVKSVTTRVFKGSDAAEWFMLSADGVHTAEKAQSLGQKLLDLGLIAPVDQDSTAFVASSKAHYYFCHPSNFAGSSEKTDGKGTKDDARGNAAMPKTKAESGVCLLL